MKRQRQQFLRRVHRAAKQLRETQLRHRLLIAGNRQSALGDMKRPLRRSAIILADCAKPRCARDKTSATRWQTYPPPPATKARAKSRADPESATGPATAAPAKIQIRKMRSVKTLRSADRPGNDAPPATLPWPERIQQPLAKLLKIRLPIHRRGQTVGEQCSATCRRRARDSSSGDFPSKPDPRPNAEPNTITDRLFQPCKQTSRGVYLRTNRPESPA